MATKTKATIDERIEDLGENDKTMAGDFLKLRLRMFVHSLRTEMKNPAATISGRLLEDAECVKIAKKLLNRALKAEFTRADVEAFLRG